MDGCNSTVFYVWKDNIVTIIYGWIRKDELELILIQKFKYNLLRYKKCFTLMHLCLLKKCNIILDVY